MKKTIYLLSVVFLICFQGVAQNMPLPDPNTPNILFLKFSKILNSPKSFTEALVRSNNGVDLEWQNSYLFYSKDNQGRNINLEFYTLDKNYCGYTELATYNNVAISKEQLKALLEPHPYYLRTQQIRNYSKIYLIDLDSPQPKQPKRGF
ncbi:MAG: hypothetical protein MUC49_16050 [Raineya sp.]|nr:hypothetical protein [Raineya sp.]